MAAQSVCLYKGGTLRLSPDLVTAAWYRIWVVRGNTPKLVLEPAEVTGGRSGNVRKLWYGNSSAKSGFLHVASAVKMLGGDLVGEFPVTVGADKKITITLRRKNE